MANTNAPCGFTPVKHLTGGQVRSEEFEIASGYATAIYPGDWVKPVNDGTIARAAAGDTTLLGVFAGCQYVKTDGETIFSKIWPASQTIKSGTRARAIVYVDPQIVYEAQVSTVVGLTGVHALFDILATAGDATLECSREQVDGSTAGTADGQVRMIGYVEAPDNDRTLAYARAYFVVNEAVLRSTAGV